MKPVALGLGMAVALTLGACSDPHAPVSAGPSTASSATAPNVPAAAAGEASSARYDGYGAMRFGMDVAAFKYAWQGELAGSAAPSDGCSYLRPAWVGQPRDFGFMFEHGRFVRYDVGTDRETAPGGGRVGMDVAAIRARYGDAVQASPHKYVEGARYLRVTAPGGNAALVFETDAQGKVTSWRVGVPPQIDYLEGCG